jgi:hypothetical protein
VNKQSGFVYFLHIPKTSGLSITSEIERINSEDTVDGRNIFPISKKFENTSASMKPKSIICGHFALNPFDLMEFDYSFSIIREPVSRLMSLFAYHHRLDIANLSNKKLFMNFIFGEHPRIMSVDFAGFDGQPNSQSSYLSTKVHLDACGFKCLPGSPSIEKVLTSIKEHNINVFTLDNRDVLIGKLSVVFGSQIVNTRSNDSPVVGFELTKHDISGILKLNNIDHELYETVRERELCSN